jgi:hypothetical protein
MSATQQTIEVKIKALVAGLREVQKFQSEIKGIEKLAGRKLSVNTSGAERGISRLTGLLRFLSPTAEMALQKVEGLEKATGSSLGAFGKATGVVGAFVAGMFLLTKVASDAGSEIKDLSVQTGYSAETVSGLKNSVESAGGTIQDLTPGLASFNVQLAENVDKGSKASASFKLLGKDIKDNEDALRRAFKVLHEETNATRKAQIAKELFSKSYKSVLGVVEATNGDLDKAIAQYRELGTLIDTETAEAADKFGDELTQLWQQIKGLGIQIGTGLMPVLRLLLGLVNFLISAFHAMGNAIDWAMKKMGGSAVDRFIGLFRALTPGLTLSSAAGSAVEGMAGRGGGDGIEGLPGGGKGGGGKNKRPEIDTFDSELSLQKTEIESEFNLLKDALERENTLVEEQLADRLTSIKQFYADVKRIQTEALDSEERKLNLEKAKEKERFDHAVNKLNGEDLTELEKKAKIDIERNKSAEVYARINERLSIISRERVDLADRIKRDEREATAELQKQIADITSDLRDAQGRTADAEATHIGQRFKEILTRALANSGEELTQPIKDVIAEIERLGGVTGSQFKDILDLVGLNFADMSQEVQNIIELIDLLIRKAKIAEGLNRADQIFESRNLRISEIEGQRQGNYLAELRVRREINEENKKYIADLEDIIRGLEVRAQLEKDPQLINAVRQRRIELERMKREQETFGQLLKDTAVNSAVDGLSNMFANIARDASNAKEYVRDFFASFLDEINRVIIRMLVMRALMKIIGFISGGDDDVTDWDPDTGFALPGAASGGAFKANPGGRIIRVAEGGFDEVVLTTDPKHRSRTQRLLAAFLTRTGMAAPFARGGFASGESILASIASSIPRLAAGDFISNLPAPNLGALPGGNQTNNFNFKERPNGQSRIPSRAAFRDAARLLRGSK